jgi:hypothetical protein
MQSQSPLPNIAQNGSSTGIRAPQSSHVDAEQSSPGGSDRIMQVSDTLVQLPIVNIVYRGLKNWQSEFSPRVYDNRRRSVPPAAKSARRGGFGAPYP